jgi:hypothetical protein
MVGDDALDRLRALLQDAGVNPDSPSADDVQRTWDVVRAFAAEPVEDAEPRDQEGDGILAQYGIYDWGDGEHFELDMTRQLSFADEDGEYSHMAQLQCTFLFEPTDELRALGDENLWSFDLPLDAFFNAGALDARLSCDPQAGAHAGRSGPRVRRRVTMPAARGTAPLRT